MAKMRPVQAFLQLCALLAGASAMTGQGTSMDLAEACRWCTGPYKCEKISEDGWTSCKVEGAEKCEGYGNPCFHS